MINTAGIDSTYGRSERRQAGTGRGSRRTTGAGVLGGAVVVTAHPHPSRDKATLLRWNRSRATSLRYGRGPGGSTRQPALFTAAVLAAASASSLVFASWPA
ncbi:hypothetical protein GCM10023320_65550 [Pseudonocardia adelaidensis]|uniref:Uncharacterized protein n=1 Tax=Pseudonocardia adelaidensis TaxID=648754 RepID=A0ABP9NWB1_9PSEU